MRSSKPLTMIVIGTAVLALGITAVVGTALAQTPTATPTQPPTPTSKPAPGAAMNNYRNFFVDRLAADLGTTTDKLKSAFTQARNETVDQAVKDGKLTQQQADKIKANSNAGPGFGFGFGFGGHPGRGEMGRGFMGGPQAHQWKGQGQPGARPQAAPSNSNGQSAPAAQ